MIDKLIPNVKPLDKGEEQILKMVIDNEVSALKEHYDITLHKTLVKVQLPKNDETWKDLDKLCVLESNQNGRRRYIWYEVALNAINGYEDLKFNVT